MRTRTFALSLAVILTLVLGLASPTGAIFDQEELSTVSADVAQYLVKTVPAPDISTIGGDWTVMALARLGAEVPDGYYDAYYTRVCDYITAKGGVLSERKYTDYARVCLALTAIGADPSDVAGYDLTLPLGDYETVLIQGINGPIFALLALDAGSFEMPAPSLASVPATRDMYICHILSNQRDDGAFSLSKGAPADPDVTAMALLALARYRDRDDVSAAVDHALLWLSDVQLPNGGYDSWGEYSSETTSQVTMALCELGISIDDSRFVKNGRTVVDYILSHRLAGGGFYRPPILTSPNLMATEQSLLALAAVSRSMGGKNSLYSMDDAVTLISSQYVKEDNRHEDISPPQITYPGRTFDDIVHSPYREAVEKLAALGVVSGVGPSSFEPGRTMTRAEFSTITVKALGLTPSANGLFSDVLPGQWHAGYVGAAQKYGIVQGVGGGRFNPDGIITREEGAVMIARAAALCGLDTKMGDGAIRDVLSLYDDYLSASGWAKEGLAFCLGRGILEMEGFNLEPGAPISRAEISEMIYNLLVTSGLLDGGQSGGHS